MTRCLSVWCLRDCGRFLCGCGQVHHLPRELHLAYASEEVCDQDAAGVSQEQVGAVTRSGHTLARWTHFKLGERRVHTTTIIQLHTTETSIQSSKTRWLTNNMLVSQSERFCQDEIRLRQSGSKGSGHAHSEWDERMMSVWGAERKGLSPASFKALDLHVDQAVCLKCIRFFHLPRFSSSRCRRPSETSPPAPARKGCPSNSPDVTFQQQISICKVATHLL